MAWETRNGRGRYYTRSKKINGRVVREYIGTGLIGELAAAQDSERRARRLEEEATWKAAKAEMDELGDVVNRFSQDVSRLLGLSLLSAGYYRHNRGEWRCRRVRNRRSSCGQEPT